MKSFCFVLWTASVLFHEQLSACRLLSFCYREQARTQGNTRVRVRLESGLELALNIWESVIVKCDMSHSGLVNKNKCTDTAFLHTHIILTLTAHLRLRSILVLACYEKWLRPVLVVFGPSMLAPLACLGSWFSTERRRRMRTQERKHDGSSRVVLHVRAMHPYVLAVVFLYAAPFQHCWPVSQHHPHSPGSGGVSRNSQAVGETVQQHSVFPRSPYLAHHIVGQGLSLLSCFSLSALICSTLRSEWHIVPSFSHPSLHSQGDSSCLSCVFCVSRGFVLSSYVCSSIIHMVSACYDLPSCLVPYPDHDRLHTAYHCHSPQPHICSMAWCLVAHLFWT